MQSLCLSNGRRNAEVPVIVHRTKLTQAAILECRTHESFSAVAAFSGLRESEIRGLQHEDYDGDVLNVRRSVWRTHVGETKTVKSKSFVPIIKPLRKILDDHRKRNGTGEWLFAGTKRGHPLNLDNLSARIIRPAIGDKWHGWQAFRRGLATNLFGLGVPAEVAQTILRHSDVSTTRKHYILLKSRKEERAAMRRLERAVGQGMGKARNRQKRSSPRKH